MPSLIVEYTDNLPAFEPARTIGELTRVIADAGEFSEGAIKSRALRLDAWQVGTAAKDRGFVYATLHILSGRDDATKKRVAESLVEALRKACQWPAGVEVQLCCEVVDIHRESFTKAVEGP